MPCAPPSDCLTVVVRASRARLAPMMPRIAVGSMTLMQTTRWREVCLRIRALACRVRGGKVDIAGDAVARRHILLFVSPLPYSCLLSVVVAALPCLLAVADATTRTNRARAAVNSYEATRCMTWFVVVNMKKFPRCQQNVERPGWQTRGDRRHKPESKRRVRRRRVRAWHLVFSCTLSSLRTAINIWKIMRRRIVIARPLVQVYRLDRKSRFFGEKDR